jgi:hypothetical protein
MTTEANFRFWMTIENENIVETVTEYGKLVGTFGV